MLRLWIWTLKHIDGVRLFPYASGRNQPMLQRTLPVIAALLLVGWALPANAKPIDARTTEVKVFDAAERTLHGVFAPFGNSEQGGTVAVADTNADGIGEIIVGSGADAKASVTVFSHKGVALVKFAPYPRNVRTGVQVAACDLDGDGSAEIITGTQLGNGPLVRVFTAEGEPAFTPGFYPFNPKERRGVQVACGDVDGDGLRDLVAGSGVGAKPLVRVFDRYGGKKPIEIRPFQETFRGGVAIAVANVDGGSKAEIITAMHRFGQPYVKVFKAARTDYPRWAFLAWPADVRGGFSLAAPDVDGDGRAEIAVGVANNKSPQVHVFNHDGTAVGERFFAYEKNFRGGTSIAAGNVDGRAGQEIVAISGKNTFEGNPGYRKYVDVRISEQKLFAYENGALLRSFLVSTGITKYPTPLGTFAIDQKVFLKDYQWTYGPNHPDNYDIKDVKYNLRFAPTYFLHYAYWHNDFGRRRSHGCVNINLENSKWLYGWMDVGDTVLIRE